MWFVSLRARSQSRVSDMATFAVRPFAQSGVSVTNSVFHSKFASLSPELHLPSSSFLNWTYDISKGLLRLVIGTLTSSYTREARENRWIHHPTRVLLLAASVSNFRNWRRVIISFT
jgi:hypothetical protein